ncbi:MAG: RimK/LysX family protein [Acidimicrobiia bacterium]|nr:RimK/LysX family protein [Acidimicrobiia bacterium]
MGWREWVGLPEFDIEWIKAKIDTGARTSSLHGDDIEVTGDNVSFTITPWQGSELDSVRVTTELLDWRTVRSSSGESEERPTVLVEIRILDQLVPVELTLTRRDQMGFRMLVGREGLRNRFTVDSGRSYFGGRPPRELRKRNRENDEDE